MINNCVYPPIVCFYFNMEWPYLGSQHFHLTFSHNLINQSQLHLYIYFLASSRYFFLHSHVYSNDINNDNKNIYIQFIEREKDRKGKSDRDGRIQYGFSLYKQFKSHK